MNTKRLLENYQHDYKLYEYLRGLEIDLLDNDLNEYRERLHEYLSFLQSGVLTERVIQRLIDLNEQDYKFFDYLWMQYMDLEIDRNKLSDWERRLLDSGEILDIELAKVLQTINQ